MLADIKPVLIVIAGPNGAGKTSITSKILQHQWVEGCIYINPDIIAQERFGDWNSQTAVKKAIEYSSDLREKCLSDKVNFIFETVLSAEDKLDFLKKAKDEGYFIRLFFVGTNHPSINASRITRRVMQGGHDVPISKIISRYSKSIANCAIVSKMIDRLYVYDNSVEFVEPLLLFRTMDGKLIKTYRNVDNWAKPILDYLNE
ncbi:MAG: zeta toxin family protein [Candidatus Kapabacteria bacterium]|nr:zeta toxin family protein [Candidatus Kapabacteria bacterium]